MERKGVSKKINNYADIWKIQRIGQENKGISLSQYFRENTSQTKKIYILFFKKLDKSKVLVINCILTMKGENSRRCGWRYRQRIYPVCWFWSNLLSSSHCVTTTNMRMLDDFAYQIYIFWFNKIQIKFLLLVRLFWGLSNRRCMEMIETVQNSMTLQNHHCRKHN